MNTMSYFSSGVGFSIGGILGTGVWLNALYTCQEGRVSERTIGSGVRIPERVYGWEKTGFGGG